MRQAYMYVDLCMWLCCKLYWVLRLNVLLYIVHLPTRNWLCSCIIIHCRIYSRVSYKRDFICWKFHFVVRGMPYMCHKTTEEKQLYFYYFIKGTRISSIFFFHFSFPHSTHRYVFVHNIICTMYVHCTGHKYIVFQFSIDTKFLIHFHTKSIERMYL